jgi:Ca-activated chloride channel family protein
MIASPVLTGVGARFDGVDARDIEPASLPDVFAQRPVILFGKWNGRSAGHLQLTGRSGGDDNGRPFVAELPFARATTVPADTLARLWARTRITALADDFAVSRRPETVAAITELGLKHELLTDHTSFVAVDEIIRRTTPDLTTVKQPLPLPDGVSNRSVGQDIGVAPEPGAAGLLIVAGALAVIAVRPRRRVA